MKNLEGRFKTSLPRRVYTIIRLDGRAFHSFTKGCEKPFDRGLMDAMQGTTLALCKEVGGCKIGYTQSDEITLILTDFEELGTQAWFDGQVQKIVSVSAAIATSNFNKLWLKAKIDEYNLQYASDVSFRYDDLIEFINKIKLAQFDSRVYTTSDPWEAFNACHWRQADASKNSIQMIARSLFSHKELQNKGFSALNELLFTKGKKFQRLSN